MDQLIRMLLRASVWSRQKPSRTFVYALIGVAILVAVVFSLDALGWWPEWATVEPSRGIPRGVILPKMPSH
jgi:hypothetical protein